MTDNNHPTTLRPENSPVRSDAASPASRESDPEVVTAAGILMSMSRVVSDSDGDSRDGASPTSCERDPEVVAAAGILLEISCAVAVPVFSHCDGDADTPASRECDPELIAAAEILMNIFRDAACASSTGASFATSASPIPNCDADANAISDPVVKELYEDFKAAHALMRLSKTN